MQVHFGFVVLTGVQSCTTWRTSGCVNHRTRRCDSVAGSLNLGPSLKWSSVYNLFSSENVVWICQTGTVLILNTQWECIAIVGIACKRLFLSKVQTDSGESDTVRGLPYLTSPSPIRKSADCVPFVCFLGPPSLECGRHI